MIEEPPDLAAQTVGELGEFAVRLVRGALGASRDPWKAVAQVGTQREGEIGGWLYRNAMGWDWPMATHIQDPLSLRMMSQVFGTTFKSLIIAGQTILDATGPAMSLGMVAPNDMYRRAAILVSLAVVLLSRCREALSSHNQISSKGSSPQLVFTHSPNQN